MYYKKNKESNPERAKFIIQKDHNTARINTEKENSILAHAYQIRSQGEYEEQNDEEIFTISSVNDLLEQPLHNETSKDEIMHDQVGQNEFENSDEDQIMLEDNLDYSSVQNRSRSHRERNTGESQGEQNNPQNEISTRSTKLNRDVRPIRFREM